MFTTFSLAKAEEMADLIDGYCMLFSGNKHSLVFKKLGTVKSPTLSHWVTKLLFLLIAGQNLLARLAIRPVSCPVLRS